MSAAIEQLLAALLTAWVWLVSEVPVIIAGLLAHAERVFVERQLVTGAPADGAIGIILLSAAVAIVAILFRIILFRAVVR